MTTKSRTNVTVDAGLLDEARALGVSLSATLEAGLRAAVAELQSLLYAG